MDEAKRRLLSARIDDLCREADRGYITSCAFLDPAELYFAEEYIKSRGVRSKTVFYGGYQEAERKCLFFLPSYYADALGDDFDMSELSELASEEISSHVKALRIRGSGYRKLSHRDYLGAVLNMGIERSAIGDICVESDFSAVLFALPAVADLIKSGCERIGSDKIKIEELPPSSVFSFERKMKDIRDTLASNRLDCVVSSLLSESREKAKQLILSGLVEVNYSPCAKTDFKIENGCTLSIRGVGKFIISDITEETRKGRLRLLAKKYI